MLGLAQLKKLQRNRGVFCVNNFRHLLVHLDRALPRDYTAALQRGDLTLKDSIKAVVHRFARIGLGKVF